MLTVNTVKGCCSVGEIAYLSSYAVGTGKTAHVQPEQQLHDFCQKVKNRRGTLSPLSHYILTEVTAFKRGKERTDNEWQYCEKFADLLTREKLGEVTVSPEGINPNHKTHLVRVYTWTVNKTSLGRWWKAHKLDYDMHPRPSYDRYYTGDDY